MTNLMIQATWQTLYMVFLSGLISVLGGVPLGVILLTSRPGGILKNKLVNFGLGFVVNVVRAIPFIILLVAIIPLTRLVVGTSIGTNAAVVPLSLSAIPFVARIVENALLEVPPGLTEAGLAMGGSPWGIIARILLPEAMPAIINGVTVTLITLVGYSAMAGTVGGGGLGSVAIDYGYQRFEPMVMLITVIVLIVIVYVVQWAGDWLSRHLSH